LNAFCNSTSAQASAASVSIGAINLGVVQSSCTVNGTASSSIANPVLPPLTIDIPLLGLVTIRLNEITRTGGFVTVNAVHATVVGVDVIIAQSRCASNTAYPLAVDVAQGGVGQTAAAAGLGGVLPAARPPVWLVALAVLSFLGVAQVFSVGGFLGRRRRARG